MWNTLACLRDYNQPSFRLPCIVALFHVEQSRRNVVLLLIVLLMLTSRDWWERAPRAQWARLCASALPSIQARTPEKLGWAMLFWDELNYRRSQREAKRLQRAARRYVWHT